MSGGNRIGILRLIIMYNHKKIETKWQEQWRIDESHKIVEDQKKIKYYCLDMFPYPSGVGLHVGHPRGYIATDVFSRYKRLAGFNVLHPMGWDAFGLPAENYALKHKTQPSLMTEKNVANYKRQMDMLGFSYDWSREINTTDPTYYRWTQWAFAEMFKRGLVYESYEPINWCPTCQTGLANEDLDDGKCERCATVIEKKPMRQWVIKITDYAERLLADLDLLTDWEEPIKEMQRNWIGRSEGAEILFQIKDCQLQINVFTTRPDTIFGATYLVVAPEHEIITNGKLNITNYQEVADYVQSVKNKSDLERTDLNKDKTGVELQGIKAINPASGEEIPVWVADYVLPNYGTGAIMAVPAHDERDYEFANQYDLTVKKVVEPVINDSDESLMANAQSCFAGEGLAVNSDLLNGLTTAEAKEKIIAWLEEKKLGTKKVQYKLKDWVFSRQRYWGEPIPLIYCESCKNNIEEYKEVNKVGDKFSIANFQFSNGKSKFSLGELMNPGWVVDENLPVTLPEVEHYEPSGTGESPLAKMADWVKSPCPRCGGSARRETNTMPQWAGSSWYYLRYCDPHNNSELISRDKEQYWNPVDFYVGGAEHATRHLIYARFWHKFLQDIGVVGHAEPFIKYRPVGLILAEDGRKMSKRWNNVINPNDIVISHGADALRVYEMFMGPFGEAITWNTNGLSGARKFLDRIYKLKAKLYYGETISVDGETTGKLLHKTIKKVGEDIESFKFNTAVSAMMILVNKLTELESVRWIDFAKFLIILSPFAPHLAEELWQELSPRQNGESIFKQSWPIFDPALIKDERIKLVVQVNGKAREIVEVDAHISQAEAEKSALALEKIQKWLNGQEPKKVVYVKGRLVNIVMK